MPGEPGPGFSWTHWALIAKCKKTVGGALELFRELGGGGGANVLLADRFGGLADIELGQGRNRILSALDGLLVHTNHFIEPSFADSDPIEAEHSLHRLATMKNRFTAERGRLTWVSALHCMSDHHKYPLSLCRHSAPSRPGFLTTASIVAEPAKGCLHVVRGNPCANPPASHSMPIWHP